MSLKIEFKPHKWSRDGRTHKAEVFPFVNGNPIPSIANCGYCKLQPRDDEEICRGWKDNPEEAPLFCGPICERFDLISSRRKLLEEVLA